MTFLPFQLISSVTFQQVEAKYQDHKRVLFGLIRICFVTLSVLIVYVDERYCDNTDLKRIVRTHVMRIKKYIHI